MLCVLVPPRLVRDFRQGVPPRLQSARFVATVARD
jgi:hypothetical protein